MAPNDMDIDMAEDLPRVEDLTDVLVAYLDVHGPFIRNTIDWLVRLGVAVNTDNITALLRVADPALAAAVDEALKTVNAMSDDEGLNCPICMEDDDSAAWKETPCGHRFHGRCVERWLQAKGSCPMCRHQVVTMPTAAAGDTADSYYVYTSLSPEYGQDAMEIDAAS